MYNLIPFWLNHCQSPTAYTLLEQHGYKHDWMIHGDIGGLNATTSGKFFEPDEDGEFMVAQAIWHDIPSIENPVDEPILCDIIVWHPEVPNTWYFRRGEHGLVLGEKARFESSLFDEPLTLHSTPLAWLQSGCRGSVLLDHHGLNHLYGLKNIICENIEHGTRLEAGLSMYYKTNMPRLSIPAITENRI